MQHIKRKPSPITLLAPDRRVFKDLMLRERLGNKDIPLYANEVKAEEDSKEEQSGDESEI